VLWCSTMLTLLRASVRPTCGGSGRAPGFGRARRPRRIRPARRGLSRGGARRSVRRRPGDGVGTEIDRCHRAFRPDGRIGGRRAARLPPAPCVIQHAPGRWQQVLMEALAEQRRMASVPLLCAICGRRVMTTWSTAPTPRTSTAVCAQIARSTSNGGWAGTVTVGVGDHMVTTTLRVLVFSILEASS
jgi:hypothetical protein